MSKKAKPVSWVEKETAFIRGLKEEINDLEMDIVRLQEREQYRDELEAHRVLIAQYQTALIYSAAFFLIGILLKYMGVL